MGSLTLSDDWMGVDWVESIGEGGWEGEETQIGM